MRSLTCCSRSRTSRDSRGDPSASTSGVVLERSEETSPGAWARLQEAFSRGIVGGTTDRTEVRVDVFLAELSVVREVRAVYREGVEIGPFLTEQLQSLAADRKQRERALADTALVQLAELEERLRSTGFKRRLKPFQVENLRTLSRLPHGADFSVPGAGKTTVALANYALSRASGDIQQLLVIAPIAAFPSWKEDVVALDGPTTLKLAVHAGAAAPILDSTEILLTNYNRVALDYDRIRAFVARRPTQVVLDEAHRIKRGELGVHGRSVLDLAYAARRRDTLTGTPAPQGAYDLVAPIRFLYPGQDRQILPASAYNSVTGRDEDVLRETSAAISRFRAHAQGSARTPPRASPWSAKVKWGPSRLSTRRFSGRLPQKVRTGEG